MYDYLFLTHLPSFYKVNLYNELSKEGFKVKALFISDGSVIRQGDFTGALDDVLFDYEILNKVSSYERRNKLSSALSLLRAIRRTEARVILVGGWDYVEFWLALLNRKFKNRMVVVESSIYEYDERHTFKNRLKKIFLSFTTGAIVSGLPHKKLMTRLGYQKNVIISGGVGVINKPSTFKGITYNRGNYFKLVYVGRLSEEKNIKFLLEGLRGINDIEVHIVGDGPQRTHLEEISSENVIFHGYLSNESVQGIMASSDLLVLPSLSEPWGLVIDESVAIGTPVLISNKVGCSEDLVRKFEVGEVFCCGDLDDFRSKLDILLLNWSSYKSACERLPYNELVRQQVESYEKIFD
ncbi:glycosyltransferase [Vibrio vulnificus]|uniref:glycosyltransferase n=1 Tax=Vibrio vulnificus TaxID=672 RepID=UPI00102A3441|nr:glycosyltransferase [Vibrio vulnificus]EGR0668461.1 glycosyltransferase [Vibrio vulnificus]EHU9474094.1 glycosyltransferase [Vibrio vulnificus]EJB0233992.1 glycosyltransferase [Vibrio vulnificus]EJO9872740.1 glycosyltransferase [Vibrio vulnificus]EJP4177718.1 glycosyltransferase [Vibrio vulnificus]